MSRNPNLRIVLKNTFLSCESDVDTGMRSQQRSKSSEPCLCRVMERPQLTASVMVVNEQLQRFNDLAEPLQLKIQRPTPHQQGVGHGEHVLKHSSTVSTAKAETSSTRNPSSRAWSTDASDRSDTSNNGISPDSGSANLHIFFFKHSKDTYGTCAAPAHKCTLAHVLNDAPCRSSSWCAE